MKNVHLIPTEKPSSICQNLLTDRWFIPKGGFTEVNRQYYNIYITADLEIKDGWVLNTYTNEIYFLKGFYGIQPITKKIILTTDQDLIDEGIQDIDDEFLEWFVKNPSCEFVDISTYHIKGDISGNLYYKIIIQEEEPKQLIGEKVMPLDNNNIEEEEETLEDTAKKFTENLYYKVDDSDEFNGEPLAVYDAFIEGAKWQAERMYSEEEAIQLLIKFNQEIREVDDVRGWFEQFKKK